MIYIQLLQMLLCTTISLILPSRRVILDEEQVNILESVMQFSPFIYNTGYEQDEKRVCTYLWPLWNLCVEVKPT